MNKDLTIKKLGIFGGSGFIGSNIILFLYNNLDNIKNKIYTSDNQNLIFNIDEIRIFYSRTRWNNLYRDLNSEIFNFLKINIFNEEELLQKTKDLDIIINSSGFVSFAQRDIQKLWEINVSGAKNILKASIENKVKKFIHISSISILNLCDTTHYLSEQDIGFNGFKKKFHSFSSKEEILNFNDLYEKGDKSFLKFIKNPYADSKLAGFIVCEDLAKNSDIDFINILPGTVIGKGDDNFSILKLVYNIDKNFIFGRLPGFSSFVDSYDLAKGIFNSIIYGKSSESYIISGDIENNISYKDFIIKIYNALCKINNKKRFKIFIDLPEFLTYPVAFISEKIFKSKNLTLSLIKSGYIKSKISIEKAKKELNFHPLTNINNSIENLCQDYFGNNVGKRIKNKRFFSFIKKFFVDPYVNRNSIIYISGEENIYDSKRRVYIVNHPTTFDIHTIINTSADNYYIPVDHNAFKIPIVGYLLKNCGFLKVFCANNENLYADAAKIIKTGDPLFNSIRSGRVTLGLNERLRTGGIVIADKNKADIIPYHIYIERDKIKITKILGFDFKFHPYSYYKDAIIFINILSPIKYERYHKENMTKEDYLKIAIEIEEKFIEKDREMKTFFEKNQDHFKNIIRKGGSNLKIKY
ncbi:MAG: NAD-dependent epimerase/dehydratase family protein [Exilispira sp.]